MNDSSLRDFYYRTDPALAKAVSLFSRSSRGVIFSANGDYTNININILEDMKNLYIGSRINSPSGAITPDFLLGYSLSAYAGTSTIAKQRKLDTGFTKHELKMPANLSYFGVNQNMIDIKSEDGITSEIIQEEFAAGGIVLPNPFI